jgi:polyhydroxybutyrate depolymerase
MNLVSRLVFGLALVASASPLLARDRTETLFIDGQARHFVVHLPPGAEGRPRPLLLALHGGGGRAEGMGRLTSLDAQADRAGVIVVYPQGLDRHWNDGRATIKRKADDVAFIRAVLDQVAREWPVDPQRVGVTGISNGGIFAERLGCDLADRFSLIAPVAGTLARDYRPDCHPARPLSVLQFGGTDDPIMPYAGGPVASFGGVGEGGLVMSVDDTVAFWAGVNGCRTSGPEQPIPSTTDDGTQVSRRDWIDCRAGGAVVRYRIDGGGHTWPGGWQYLPKRFIGRTTHQIDASAIIVDWLVTHPRP